ncbi:MAG: ABC transporter permease [Gammaproteobacteria bacterium]
MTERVIPLWQRMMRRPEMGAVGGALIVFVFFGIVAGDSGMFSPLGAANFLEYSAFLGIIAVAAALLMIGGEFDLSVGSMIGFAGICIAIPMAEWGWPLWLSVMFAFAVACGVGVINAALVNKTGLPSFIITLAMLFILRGLTIAITRLMTNRTQIPNLREHYETCTTGADGLQNCEINDPVAWLLSGRIGEDWFTETINGAEVPAWNGLPMVVIWWVGLAVLATFVLLRTKFGNWIFAAGGDKLAARNVGVPVERVKTILFVCTACAATLFAAIQVLDAGSADTQRGVLKEFEAIIAAVIGGCLLTGGYGSAIGAAVGALIFGTVFQGIYYTDVNTDWFKVFLGVMLIVAVVFNNYIRNRATTSG